MLEAKTFRVWFGAILLLCAICLGEALSAQEQPHSTTEAVSTYRIGTGDVLQISILGHPELSRVIPVKPDGNISFPLLNDVKVSGLSVMDVAKLLRDKLEPLVPNPQVKVIVTSQTSAPLPAIIQPLLPRSPKYSSQLRDTPSPKCCVA
jgi:polysaccharide export outer membrane protein